MSTFSLIPGDPAALAADAKKHEQFAELILAVSRQLDSVVDDSITVGKSVDAVRSQTAILSGDILKAQPRHRDTALALIDFSVALQDAQQKAASAGTIAAHAEGSLSPWYSRRDVLERELRQSLMAPLSPDDLERLKRDISTTEQEISQLESDLARATRDYLQAVHDRDQAAQVAIGRIRPALDELNDSFLDRVSAALNDVTGFISATEQWIAHFLTDVLFDEILVVVGLVAIVIVVGVLAIVAPLLDLLLLTGVIHLDDLQSSLNILVKSLLVLLPILVPALLALLYKESLTKTPDMRVQGSILGDERKRGNGVGMYQDAFINDDDLDNSGGDTHTTVSIIQVMNPDGTPPNSTPLVTRCGA